jgi:hypothetical protein
MTRTRVRGGVLSGRKTVSRFVVACFLLAGVLGLAVSCSVPGGTPVYSKHIFRIIATSGYSGYLTSDTNVTSVSGSTNRNITVVVSARSTYTLDIGKTSNDGKKLEVELISESTLNGKVIDTVVEKDSVTDMSRSIRLTVTG